jgi:hypothetical protein
MPSSGLNQHDDGTVQWPIDEGGNWTYQGLYGADWLPHPRSVLDLAFRPDRARPERIYRQRPASPT